MKYAGRQKVLFGITVAAAGVMILIFNFLTPMMTDDLSYAAQVTKAASLFDLIGQEYQQYMNWSGRSVSHLILRCFLKFDKIVFNLANSAVFILLTLLIYRNIEKKKKHDIRIYIFINLLLWQFGVVFRQTILWETGACNYLWGSTIIMSFVTLYRYRTQYILEKGKNFHAGIWLPIMFVLGLLAGWCNENTSGGGILLVLLTLFFFMFPVAGNKERQQRRRPALWMFAGLAGQITGFLFMVLAPGNAIRSQFQEEEHTGLFALVSRFQKITLALRENFLPLLILTLLLFIVICLQQKKARAVWEHSRNGICWFAVFMATCYALIFTPEPMPRAYFGAGIFLTVAVVQLFCDVLEHDLNVRAVKLGLISVMGLLMFFTYMDSGADMARIFREYKERDAYLEQKAAEGAQEVTVPMLRPDFDTKYSDGYNSDLQEDPDYWINGSYEAYYRIPSIRAVPRDEWTEY